MYEPIWKEWRSVRMDRYIYDRRLDGRYVSTIYPGEQFITPLPDDPFYPSYAEDVLSETGCI